MHEIHGGHLFISLSIVCYTVYNHLYIYIYIIYSILSPKYLVVVIAIPMACRGMFKRWGSGTC